LDDVRGAGERPGASMGETIPTGGFTDRWQALADEWKTARNTRNEEAAGRRNADRAANMEAAAATAAAAAAAARDDARVQAMVDRERERAAREEREVLVRGRWGDPTPPRPADAATAAQPRRSRNRAAYVKGGTPDVPDYPMRDANENIAEKNLERVAHHLRAPITRRKQDTVEPAERNAMARARGMIARARALHGGGDVGARTAPTTPRRQLTQLAVDAQNAGLSREQREEALANLADLEKYLAEVDGLGAGPSTTPAPASAAMTPRTKHTHEINELQKAHLNVPAGEIIAHHMKGYRWSGKRLRLHGQFVAAADYPKGLRRVLNVRTPPRDEVPENLPIPNYSIPPPLATTPHTSRR